VNRLRHVFGEAPVLQDGPPDQLVSSQVRAASPAQADVDPARVQQRERDDLLGRDQWRVVADHHPASTQAHTARLGRGLADERERGTRRHVGGQVVFGEPQPVAAELVEAPGPGEALGQGVGTRLMALAVEASRASGLERVELAVFADNHRARRLYEKMGFTIDGTRTRRAKIDGRYRDEVLMARVL